MFILCIFTMSCGCLLVGTWSWGFVGGGGDLVLGILLVGGDLASEFPVKSRR